MGMIQTLLKRVPEGKSRDEFMRQVEQRLPEFAAGSEHSVVRVLTTERFDEAWQNQDNLKETPEVEAKYRKLTAEGQVIEVEIDW
jgi:hypothetical protein